MGLYDTVKRMSRGKKAYRATRTYRVQVPGKSFSGLGERISSAFEDLGDLIRWVFRYIGSVLDAA